MKLTPNERNLLVALRTSEQGRFSNTWVTPEYLRDTGLLDGDQPDAGTHRTAASLIRKGAVHRQVIAGIVHYRISDEGGRELARRRIAG